MKMLTVTIVAGGLLLLGCAQNAVVFVTNTGIGIDADTTTQSASIAYDRIDGYLAPRYPNGAVPPVVSSVQSSLDIFTPQISQVYATGNAALTLAAKSTEQVSKCDPEKMTVDGADGSQDKRVMFFGTATTLGLKVAFGTSGPTSFSLGFKRKEASIIPLGTSTDGKLASDAYPSVIASINLRVSNAQGLQSFSLPLSEFFATGAAANCLATLPAVHTNFDSLSNTGTKAAGPSGNNAAPLIRTQ